MDVSRETRDRLDTYVRLLWRWQQTVNLLRVASPSEIWTRHVDDALQLLPLIPADVVAAVDLGSGAGLPGLVLAIATRLEFTLVERDTRKAAFLAEAARHTGTSGVRVLLRVEDVEPRSVRLLTARALAPLAALFDLAAPLLARQAVLLLPKGKNAVAEIREAARVWCLQLRVHRSALPGDGVILVVRALAHV